MRHPNGVVGDVGGRAGGGEGEAKRAAFGQNVVETVLWSDRISAVSADGCIHYLHAKRLAHVPRESSTE